MMTGDAIHPRAPGPCPPPRAGRPSEPWLMPDPVSLADAGGWAVVIVMMTALGWAFAKGVLVPGFVYRREVERGDKADAQAERTASALEKLVQFLDVGHLDDRGGR